MKGHFIPSTLAGRALGGYYGVLKQLLRTRHSHMFLVVM